MSITKDLNLNRKLKYVQYENGDLRITERYTIEKDGKEEKKFSMINFSKDEVDELRKFIEPKGE